MGNRTLAGVAIGDRVLGASGDSHPLWSLAHARLGPFLVVGASAAGSIHLEHGRPRDDAFAIRSAGSWIAVGMADGVGSRSLSRYGASYVAESLASQLLRPLVPRPQPEPRNAPSRRGHSAAADRVLPPSGLEEQVLALASDRTNGPPSQAASVSWWDGTAFTVQSVETLAPSTMHETVAEQDFAPTPAPDSAGNDQRDPGAEDSPSLDAVVLRAFERTNSGLRDYASHLGVDLTELSCTALGLVLNLETGQGAVGQVGDGALVGLTAGGTARELVSTPESDDTQSVHTINRTSWRDHFCQTAWSVEPADPLVAFYVMTDGISNDVLYSPRPTALSDWARGVDRNLRLALSPAQAAAAMLNWIASYQVQGSWDDRTLVVIALQERNDGDRDAAAE